jgi:hypothetical protein
MGDAADKHPDLAQALRLLAETMLKDMIDEAVEKALAKAGAVNDQNASASNGKAPKKYLKPKELARVLDVSTRTVANWKDEGCPHERAGRGVRYVLEDVKAWAKQTRKRAV